MHAAGGCTECPGEIMNTNNSVTNALSFDLEHWYTATLVRESVTDPEDHIEESVDIVLNILDDYSVTATFFVVGEVAEEYPDLVAKVANAGHELGTHGYTHTPLSELNEDSFKTELTNSKAAIERAADVEVRGFRAPNFSITRKTKWALNVLLEEGFTYDSSVFPIKTPMYGVRGAPTKPYHIDLHKPFSDIGATKLLEVPVAVHPRVRIPVAGGFYARLLPQQVQSWGINALNKRRSPAVLYFHPWEFNPDVQTNEPPVHARIVSYHGIDRTETKLRYLLEEYPFASVSEILPI